MCRCPRLCDFSTTTHFSLYNLILFFIFVDSFQQTFFILFVEEKKHNDENVGEGVMRANGCLGNEVSIEMVSERK